MHDDVSHARSWFVKADSDLAAARQLAHGDGPYDTACFHAQQAAERLLKGLIALSGGSIPLVHDLDELHALCLSTGWRLQSEVSTCPS